jgi:hypothetical protein
MRLLAIEQGLSAHMLRASKASLVPKEDSAIHRGIAGAFDVAGSARELLGYLSLDAPFRVPSGEAYLSSYGTTLGGVIALPRAWIDDPTDDGAFRRTLVTPHECQHVRDWREGYEDRGPLPSEVNMPLLYLASGEERAAIEARGYAVTEALRHWFTGTMRPVEEIAATLRNHYAVDASAASLAEAMLRSFCATIAAGSVPNVWAAREALTWLRTHAPESKGMLS